MNEALNLEIDGIHAFDGAVIGLAREVVALDFIEALFGEAGIRNRVLLHHRSLEDFLRQHGLHEA